MKKCSHNSVYLSSGYTLVELLIAMSIGLFLLTGAFQVVQINKKSNLLQKTVQKTQQSGRFAIDNLSYAIKTAGYSGFYGKLSLGVENLLNAPDDEKWKVSVPVSGFDNVSGADIIAGITDFIPDTDVLILKGMQGNTVPVISSIDASTMDIALNTLISAGDILVVSDVDQASVFQVNNINNDAAKSTISLITGAGSPGNSILLDNSFNTDAEIGKYDVQMFYIKNGRNGSPSLFKTALIYSGGTMQLQENELASDIKNMQISYGIDNNNDQILDEYHDASTIVDWDQLISINVVLLASSQKINIVPEKTSFSYDANLVTFVQDAVASVEADRSLKRVFRTNMRLRN